MDRTLYPKHYPNCNKGTPLVDQYMWASKDTSQRMCYPNGISRPIYDNLGNISFTLPLSEYPGNQIHPEVQKQLRENK